MGRGAAKSGGAHDGAQWLPPEELDRLRRRAAVLRGRARERTAMTTTAMLAPVVRVRMALRDRSRNG